jgi:ParB family chromosome partitioning protein
MTLTTETVIGSGVEIDVPLNKLKKSPKNARKVPHGEAVIAALAASIGAKRMLHPLIVEPEQDGEGQPTGCYLVTIGEGRRLAQKLRAKRGEVSKTARIRCVVETVLDAHEISLDENVTHFRMHPADEFEALANKLSDGPRRRGDRRPVRRLRLGGEAATSVGS